MVLVLNFYGYRWMLSSMEDRSAALLEEQVDGRAYNDEDLVSIKTTLNLPYYAGSAEYERVSGTIEVEGTTYQYVKRRVYQDTLELLCLPNHTISKIREAKNDIARQAADTQSPLKKGGSTGKIALPDFYCQGVTSYDIALLPGVHSYASSAALHIPPGHPALPDQPPRELQCTIS